MNAVVYQGGRSRWAFTEPAPATVERRPHVFALSGSVLERTSDTLTFTLDERSAPWGTRVRGTVRIELHAGSPESFALDGAGEHRWWPVGALGRAQVELSAPALRFEGSAYHDCNYGRAPLESAFERWSWSRTDLHDQVGIVYDVVERDGTTTEMGLRIDRTGGVHPFHAEFPTLLPRGAWGMSRPTRTASAEPATLVQSLEDTPFYTRSVVRSRFDERTVHAVHESVSLDRFTQPWVQSLLPFRMRRGWRA